MEMIFCPNCNKLTGYKRVIGFGTFFAVLLTAGLWLLAIPFYPKRCITCGLPKSDSVPWYRTWRMAFVLVVGVAVVAVVVYTLLPPRTSTPSQITLLGFYGNAHDARVHAAAIGFQLKDCKNLVDGYRTECNYVRQGDEKLTLVLWRDELETVWYYFGMSRYDKMRKELSAEYGVPRTVYGQQGGGSQDEWGSDSEGVFLSLSELSDHSGGLAFLQFSGTKFELPEVQKAERRLFGKRTAEVDSLEVTSGTLQGTLAVTTRCKAHSCADRYAMWTVDLTTGEAAGALADKSTVLVCLGDYGSAENLPQVLQSEIEEQSKEGFPSPKRILYVPQINRYQ